MKPDLIEIAKLALSPEDVLVVKITSDEISMSDVMDLKNRLQTLFPANKIMMSVIPANSQLELQVIGPNKDVK